MKTRSRLSTNQLPMGANTYKLIDQVEKHRCLYDIFCSDHKDNIKKKNAWNQIAKQMGWKCSSIPRSKWRNLRDSYLKYLKANLPDGPPSSRRYLNWPWGEKMEFMKTYILDKPNESNAKEEIDTNVDLNIDEVSQGGMVIFPTNDEPEGQCESEEELIDEPEFEKEIFVSKFPKLNNIVENNMPLPSHSEERANDHMDEVDLLFLSYSRTLKKFGFRRQALIKMQISQIIGEAEIEEIEEKEMSYKNSSIQWEPRQLNCSKLK